jgi:hypothetical protein
MEKQLFVTCVTSGLAPKQYFFKEVYIILINGLLR